jgi:hypothetical protein
MSKRSTSKYLAQWQARRAPRTLELSDGLMVDLRPVDITTLMFSGSIPMPLMREVMEMKPAADGEYDPNDVAVMMPLIDAVVLATVIDPPLSPDGAEGTLPLDAIWFVDKMSIYREVSKPATALQPFRQQPDGDEAPVSGG